MKRLTRTVNGGEVTAASEQPTVFRWSAGRPPGVPAGLPVPVRVLELVDADAVSHGLAEGSGLTRTSDAAFTAALAQSRAAAIALSGGDASHVTTVIAASTETAQTHLRVALSSPGNQWRWMRGLDGANHALVEEMEALAANLERNRRKGWLPGAVLLVGQDRAYAPAARGLRLKGVPLWVLQPGRFIAAPLYVAAVEVTPLAPRLTGGAGPAAWHHRAHHPARPGALP